MNRNDLKKYRYDKEWIKDKLEFIERQKETISKTTATLTGMPMGSRKVEDNMAESIAKLLDCFNDLLNEVRKVQENQAKIEEQLLKVEQPYRIILDKVYIQGKTLVTVASEMNYSYVHICREHGIALNKFDEV